MAEPVYLKIGAHHRECLSKVDKSRYVSGCSWWGGNHDPCDICGREVISHWQWNLDPARAELLADAEVSRLEEELAAAREVLRKCRANTP